MNERARHHMKRWSIPLLLAALGGGIYLWRVPLLVHAASYLVVADELKPAGLLMVLNGDPNVRPFKTYDLYRRGLAPKVLIARAENSPMNGLQLIPNTTDMTVGVLAKLGIADSDIIQIRVPGGVTSTYDEAVVLRDYAQEHSIGSVIIVTSAFHTRRAQWIFRQVLRPKQITIMMAPVADRKYTETNWWTREDGLVACQNEYVKLLFYHWKYPGKYPAKYPAPSRPAAVSRN